MGVSVAVAYLARINQLRVFTEKQLPALIRLLEAADRVIGYNLIRFDYKVLGGCCKIDPDQIQSLDLLAEIEDATGVLFPLRNTIKATFGYALGYDARKVSLSLKEGQLEKVVEYCGNTVLAVHRLHEFGKDNAEIYCFKQPAAPGGRRKRMPIQVAWQ